MEKTVEETRLHQEDLKKNQAKFFESFLNTPIPMAITTIKDGRYTDVNKAFADVMGKTRDELIGQTSVSAGFITADQRSLFIDEFQRKGYVENMEFTTRVKNGELRYGLFNSTRITIIDEDFYLTSVTDITSLKQTQEDLRKSKELSSKLISAIPDLVVLMDMKGNIQFINDVVRQLGGYQPSEIIGQNLSNFVSAEDREKVFKNAIPALPRQSGPKKIELVARNGERRLFESNNDVLQLENGAPYNYISVLRDITDRDRMEKERTLLQERLHRAEKMEALGTLAGGVAHDLNNVMGVLVGYSDLLLEKMPQDNPYRNYVHKILESGIRSAAIIQDLLTLSRRGVAVSEIINFNDIIGNHIRSLEYERLKTDHPDIDFHVNLDPDLMNIKGSPVHLLKTLMNLLNNAVEAICVSGQIYVKTENRYLDQPVRGYDTILEGDYAVLSVSDTGKGISSDDIGKIFEPFYTKKTMGRSGTGLGLAVVWGTVKDHKGYIDVVSSEGHGTVLSLYFPVTREQPARSEADICLNDYISQGESILVVDDVPDQRDLAGNMLSSLGYQVESVNSGTEAVEYIKNKKPDLLILDMIMEPGIDGLETYQRILEIHPGQKAVIVSGFSETERVRKTMEIGAGAFVRKPYILKNIGLAVRQELDRR